jgi:hypothetical protein
VVVAYNPGTITQRFTIAADIIPVRYPNIPRSRDRFNISASSNIEQGDFAILDFFFWTILSFVVPYKNNNVQSENAISSSGLIF